MPSSGLKRLIAAAVITAVIAWGQGQEGGNSGGGGTTGGGTGGQSGGQRGGSQGQQQGTTGGTGGQRNDPLGQRQQDPFANQMRPLYLHGKVVTDDGLPPSEPVVVQRVCTGNTYPEGYTDTKGRFNFQVGGDISMLTSDASVSGLGFGSGAGMGGGVYTRDGVRQIGLGRYDLSSCVLRAELSGFRSDDVQLGIYSTMGNNDVGVIILHRLAGVVGDVVSVLTLKAPKNAMKAYQNGLREMRKQKPNYRKGVVQFEKAVSLYPQFAAAWAAMGDAKSALQETEGAKEAFSKAVENDPKYLKPYEPLIRMAVEQGDWQALESLGSAYLELNPGSGGVRFYTALAALNAGHHQKAEDMVSDLLRGNDPDRFPQSYQIMGMILEQRAEFEKAADQYRTFVGLTGQQQNVYVQEVKRKLHEWEMLGVIQKASVAP